MGKFVEYLPKSSLNHSGTGTSPLVYFSAFSFSPFGIIAFLHSTVTSSPALLLRSTSPPTPLLRGAGSSFVVLLHFFSGHFFLTHRFTGI